MWPRLTRESRQGEKNPKKTFETENYQCATENVRIGLPIFADSRDDQHHINVVMVLRQLASVKSFERSTLLLGVHQQKSGSSSPSLTRRLESAVVGGNFGAGPTVGSAESNSPTASDFSPATTRRISVPLHEILGEKHRDNQGEVVCGYHDKQGMA